MVAPVSSPSAATLLPLVIEAGELARGFFRKVSAERKADRTLVTDADRAVEAFLVERLPALVPGARILGEEFGAAGAESACTLTIDPIDGTAAFVAGLPTWCVTLGWIDGDRPAGGITVLPMTGETYVADQGEAFWNGRVIPRVTREVAEGDRFLVTYSGYRRHDAGAFAGKIRSLGSTAYHLALVARGAAFGALLGRPHVWDLTVGAAMLAAVGGEVRYRSGAAIDFKALLDGARAQEPMVAAGPGALAEVMALAPVPA
jgi:myo-inositol-1(or 4)-monophosphatase